MDYRELGFARIERPEEVVLREELYGLVRQQLEGLPESERNVLEMGFGIGYRDYKWNEVAMILDISPEGISRIKKRALTKLKKRMRLYDIV